MTNNPVEDVVAEHRDRLRTINRVFRQVLLIGVVLVVVIMGFIPIG